MGDGIPQGREPFSSEGEVYPLPEGSSGPQPAQPGTLTAAGGHPAPGDRRTSHSGHGRKTLYSGSSPLLAETSIIAYIEADNTCWALLFL